MSKIGTKGILRDRVDAQGHRYIGFFCPGCRHAHIVGVDGKQQSGRNWSWNGDADLPVLSPSIAVSVGGEGSLDPDTGKPYPKKMLCHSFVGCNGAAPGQIIFLDDSEGHQLRGAHDLVPWPETYGGMED